MSNQNVYHGSEISSILIKKDKLNPLCVALFKTQRTVISGRHCNNLSFVMNHQRSREWLEGEMIKFSHMTSKNYGLH